VSNLLAIGFFMRIAQYLRHKNQGKPWTGK
jgi:hypothetical protein